MAMEVAEAAAEEEESAVVVARPLQTTACDR